MGVGSVAFVLECSRGKVPGIRGDLVHFPGGFPVVPLCRAPVVPCSVWTIGKVPGIRGDLVHFPVEVTGLSGFMQTKGCQGCTLIGAIKAADFPVPAGEPSHQVFP